MSKDWYQDVYDFHAKFGCTIGSSPGFPDDKVQKLRESIEREEFEEMLEANARKDMPEVADGIADLIYVLLGRAVSYGIDLRPIWDEVQRTNMEKVGGTKREDGKILKPEGWKPPDVAGLLEKQVKRE
jgi:predicted HAD superfamily Cof-like phosphohydrolase